MVSNTMYLTDEEGRFLTHIFINETARLSNKWSQDLRMSYPVPLRVP